MEELCELFSRQICSKRHLLHREKYPRPTLLFIDAPAACIYTMWGLTFHFFWFEKIKLSMCERWNENMSASDLYLLWDTSLYLIQASHNLLWKFKCIPIRKTNMEHNLRRLLSDSFRVHNSINLTSELVWKIQHYCVTTKKQINHEMIFLPWLERISYCTFHINFAVWCPSLSTLKINTSKF